MMISNSEIATWARCPRQWLLKYFLGLVPAEESAASHRNQGSRVHTALEAYHGYQLDPLAVLGILYRIETERHPEETAELKAEYDMSEAMVSGYLEWLAESGADADWQVVATEADVQVPLPGQPEIILRARMDQVGQRISDGSLAFLDYKTSATFEKHEYLDLDPQFRFYCLIQQMAVGNAGLENPPLVSGGMVTTLKRVKRTARSRPPYYMRDDFWYTPERIESTLLRVQKIASEIKEAREVLSEFSGNNLDRLNYLQRTEVRPVPIVHDCSWSCPFSSGLCTMMDDGSDWIGAALRSGRYRQADPYTYYASNSIRTIREALQEL